MKTSLAAFFCLLSLAVAGWSIKSATENHPAAESTAPIAAQQTESAQSEDVPSSFSPDLALANAKIRTSVSGGSPNVPVSPAVQYPTTPGTSAGSFLSGAHAAGGSMPAATRSAPTVSSVSHATASTATSTSTQPVGAAVSNGNASGVDNTVLELDPGVPMPVAFVAPEENQTPTAAAAQQQIADAFVEEVDNTLNESATSNNDAAINEAYYDSLARSNEQYRALYGDEAFNRQVMKATLESQSGN